MASTIALPFRPVRSSACNSHFNHEQANIIDQECEYDADVETFDTEDEEPQCKVNKSITSPAQVANSPVLAWQAFSTTQSDTAGVEVAEVDIAVQADIFEAGNWHASRTPQIEPVEAVHSRSSGWTPINIPSMSTSQIDTSKTVTSDTEDTQSSVLQASGWSVNSGSQTDTSQATSVELDKSSFGYPSFGYPQTWNTLHFRPSKTTKPFMKTAISSPQLKLDFRKYKKEYTSPSTKEHIKWLRHRIACLDTGNKDEYNSEMAVLGSEWGSFWERRRWLKQEMLKIKNLYTLARRRRQERIRYNLRASYDIAFIKSLGEK